MAIITETVRLVLCGGWRVSSGRADEFKVTTGGRSWGTRRKRSEGGGSVGAGDRTTGAWRDGDTGFSNVTESGWVIKTSGEHSSVRRSRGGWTCLETSPSEQRVVGRRSTRNSMRSRVDVEEFGFLPQLDDRPPRLRKPRSVPYCFFDRSTSSSPDDNRASHDDQRDGK